MPTYEYECNRCGERTELQQRVSDPPLKKCGKCGGQVRKLVFPVGVIYKGSGFYTTDYARKGASRDDDGNGKKDTKLDSKDQPSTATKT
ncbi:MAG TPA: FmdB family zinc ribbon protein [Armatimonadota bacterium]|nr:FmdB family zinc ribbon protein [Armatimonadota bacterium]